MINKIKQYVKKNNMLQKNDKVVLGVSGGADSVCLFFVMLELKKVYQLELFVVHINHGIRGIEADEDEVFVKQLCEKEQVNYHAIKADIIALSKSEGISLEEAGRNVRYQAFYEESEKYQCNKIAVAHNMNDSAETVLFHLFRGSGIKGLTGISPVRENIIRPLLCVERSQIEEYLSELGVGYQTDQTNLLDEYSRNKIRLNILSYVTKEINNKATQHIVNSAVMLSEIEAYIETNTKNSYNKLVIYHKEDEKYSFFVEDFQKEDIVIKKNILRKIIFQLVNQLKDIDAEHIDMVLSLLSKGVGKKVDLPYELQAIREYETIAIYQKKQRYNEIFHIEVKIPGDYYIESLKQYIHFEVKTYDKSERISQKNRIIPRNSYTKWFDYDKIKNTVFIRTRQMGDFVQIDDKGNKKKIKSLFIDNKVPREQRDRIPLLADGNHVIWVIGDRISEAYKITEQTQRILIAQLYGGNNDVRQN